MSASDENRKLFVMVTCLDKAGEGAADERQKYLMDHFKYIETIMDRILVAGPIFADDKQTIIGSVLIYKTEDKAVAREMLESDPYFSADIWDSVVYQTFRGALGDAVGGKAY